MRHASCVMYHALCIILHTVYTEWYRFYYVLFHLTSDIWFILKISFGVSLLVSLSLSDFSLDHFGSAGAQTDSYQKWSILACNSEGKMNEFTCDHTHTHRRISMKGEQKKTIEFVISMSFVFHLSIIISTLHVLHYIHIIIIFSFAFVASCPLPVANALL